MAKRRPEVTRAYIHSLRGKYRHLNALRILEEERAKDREREEAKVLYWTMRRAKQKRPRQ